MKLLTTVGAGAAAVLSLGLATHASAYSLNPKSSPVTIAGPTTMSVLGIPFANCTSTFKGSIDSTGVGSITSAVFSGSSTCTSITAANLPWGVTATGLSGSTGNVSISSVEVKEGLVTCGPGTVTGTVDNSTGNATFSGSLGVCGVASNPTVPTSPAVSVSNP
jgi:hypothetical protein